MAFRDSPTRYVYIKVMEGDGLTNNYSKPLVVIKYNGSELLNKKSTRTASGAEWWSETMKFEVKDIDMDWFAVEVRGKRVSDIFSSHWIGELQLKVSAFKDGTVHDCWYQMGRGIWKHHTRPPRGNLHIQVQIMSNKYDRPFANECVGMTISEWRLKGSPMPGYKQSSPNFTYPEKDKRFELTFPNMEEATRCVTKNSFHFLNTERPTSRDEIAEIKKLNRVNCLHRGKFENCSGKIYMVAVDGTKSADEAFEHTLKLLNPEDHLFFVTVRERLPDQEEIDEESSTVLRYQLWRAAAGIITSYQDKLFAMKTKIEFTSVMPEAWDAREVLCALARRYKVDVLVVAKHKKGELRHKSRYFRSFSTYVVKNSKCSVVVY